MQHSPGNNAEFPLTGAPPAVTKLQLTPEELAILKECNKQALYKRGIPVGAVCGYGTYFAIKTGFLKPHIRYGPIPAVAIGSLIGALLGSFSYRVVCIQKVLSLPNSNLKRQVEAALLKEKPVVIDPVIVTSERTELNPETDMISGTQMESYSSTSSFDGYSGVDIDSDQPPKFDNVILGKYEGPSQTYDELRRKNREEYIRSTSFSYPQQQQQQQQQSTDPRFTRSQPILPEERPRFDRDRVPQYQLVD